MKTSYIIKIYKYIESLRESFGIDVDDYTGKEPLEITEDSEDYVFHLKTYHGQPRQVKINKDLLMRAAFDVDEASVAINDIFTEALKETAEEAEARRIKHEAWREREKMSSGVGLSFGAGMGASVGTLTCSPLLPNFDDTKVQTLLNSWLGKK